jgi:hypothetical protein
LKWLDDHPITEIDNIEFLKKVVAFKKQNSIEGLDAQRAEKELHERGWHGSSPYLHLIHCLVDSDIIKNAFCTRTTSILLE